MKIKLTTRSFKIIMNYSNPSHLRYIHHKPTSNQGLCWMDGKYAHMRQFPLFDAANPKCLHGGLALRIHRSYL